MSLMKRLTSILGGREAADGAEPQAEPAASATPTAATAEPGISRGQLVSAIELLATEINAMQERLQSLTAIESAVAGLVPMLQFSAKAAERSDRARDQQIVDLRAHFTAETDRLAKGLRQDTTKSAALDLFSELLPALDEMDDILRAHAERAETMPGFGALGLLRRRLRDTFDRLGITELSTVERGSAFDPELYEGVPCADNSAVAGIPSGNVVEVIRAGYRQGDQLIRAARVTVAP